MADDRICEYPVQPRQLAVDLTLNHLTPRPDGELALPGAPGRGMQVNPKALETYKVEVEIKVKGKRIYP